MANMPTHSGGQPWNLAEQRSNPVTQTRPEQASSAQYRYLHQDLVRNTLFPDRTSIYHLYTKMLLVALLSGVSGAEWYDFYKQYISLTC